MYSIRCLIALTTIYACQAVNILAVFPTPAYSHHIVYKTYIEGLTNQCYNVTVIKPKLIKYWTNSSNCGSLIEINADLSTQEYKELISKSANFKIRGVVADENSVTASNYIGLIEMFKNQFNHANIREFIAKQPKFDLLITEAFADYALIFSHLFNSIPVIQIAPGYGLPENFETVGALARHPIFYPNIWRSNFKRDNSEAGIKTETRLFKEFQTLTHVADKMLKTQFGPDTPTIEELRNRVQLLLLNLHPIFDNNRPVPPSVHYLGGGLHLLNKTIPRLEQSIENFLNTSKNGSVYVSFGSSVDTNALTRNFLNTLLKTFVNLPNFKFLWKVDTAVVKNITLPSNVMTQSWFNQRAVLNHPNTIAFVTQGGVQSSDESLQAQVPMVCLPMMGDQFYHCAKLQDLGTAQVLNTSFATSQELITALLKVTSNKSYKNNCKQLSKLINTDNADFPSLDTALKLTKKVLRYNKNDDNNVYSMKPTAANKRYFDYCFYRTTLSILKNYTPLFL